MRVEPYSIHGKYIRFGPGELKHITNIIYNICDDLNLSVDSCNITGDDWHGSTNGRATMTINGPGLALRSPLCIELDIFLQLEDKPRQLVFNIEKKCKPICIEEAQHIEDVIPVVVTLLCEQFNICNQLIVINDFDNRPAFINIEDQFNLKCLTLPEYYVSDAEQQCKAGTQALCISATEYWHFHFTVYIAPDGADVHVKEYGPDDEKWELDQHETFILDEYFYVTRYSGINSINQQQWCVFEFEPTFAIQDRELVRLEVDHNYVLK